MVGTTGQVVTISAEQNVGFVGKIVKSQSGTDCGHKVGSRGQNVVP